MPVSILYYKVTPDKISSVQLTELIHRWSEELPTQKQQQIRQLRQQNDQVLSLAGLQLLKMALPAFSDNPFTLKQLCFPNRGKPFIAGELEGKIDFNISHSADIVCCVISDNMKVGIDIEVQRAVKPATMNKYLSPRSSEAGNTEEDDIKHFFDVWTKNEAIIKAANHGSIYNMNEICFEPDTALYQEQRWHFYPVNIHPADTYLSQIKKEYTCHIACSEKIAAEDLNQTIAQQIHTI